MSAADNQSQPIVARLRHLAKLLGFDLPVVLNEAADRIEELEAALQESRIHFEQITDGARVDDDLLERIEVVLGIRGVARAEVKP